MIPAAEAVSDILYRNTFGSEYYHQKTHTTQKKVTLSSYKNKNKREWWIALK